MQNQNIHHFSLLNAIYQILADSLFLKSFKMFLKLFLGQYYNIRQMYKHYDNTIYEYCCIIGIV